MRILLLCAMAFAVGLLAGALFRPGERVVRERAPVPAREAAPARAEQDARATTYPDPFAPEETDTTTRERVDARVRDLVAEASADLREVLARAAAVSFLAGDGRITGTVRDPSGLPVAGVVVTAVPEAQPSGLAVAARRARARQHEDRDLDDVAREAIEFELWRRHVRATATSGADGRYALTGLAKARHRVAAWHDAYDVQPAARQQNIEPDATLDFVAQPVLAVPVEVRLPDGSVPPSAWVSWQGPDGPGWDYWAPEPGTVRLPEGSCRVKAQVWLPEPLQSAEVEHAVRRGAEQAPLVLALEGRPVLTARLAMPEGLAVPASVVFRLRLLVDRAAEIDPAKLTRDANERTAPRETPGRATWFDLEPGRYLVAAFLEGQRFLGHAVADLGEAAVEIDLPVEAPTPDGYLAVTLLGPQGGPVNAQPTFHVVTGTPPRWRYHDTNVMRRADGTWLVLVPETGADVGDEAHLRVLAPGYGSALHPFRLKSPGSALIRFREPGGLLLRVDGYAGSPVEGRLYAALLGDEGLVATGQVGPDGRCAMKGVQPGEFGLLLFVRGGGDDRWPILRRVVSLGAGEDERTLSVPPLHVLRVRPAGALQRAREVALSSSDEDIGPLRRKAPVRDGVATFGGLAAGTYEIACGPRSVQVRVPGPPEVTIE